MRVLTSEELMMNSQVESIKQQYITQNGQSVSPERFIFACYDTIRNLRQIEGGFRREYEWPELGQPSSEKFSVRLQSLIDWHYANHVEFHPDRIIDVAKLTYLSLQLAHLEKDFRRLCQQSMLHDDKSQRPAQAAIDELVGIIEKKFGKNLAPYLVAFFKWIYLKPLHIGVDLNQVPPVGRYAKMVLRSREKRKVEPTGQNLPDTQFSRPDHTAKAHPSDRKNQDQPAIRKGDVKGNKPHFKQKESFFDNQPVKQPSREMAKQAIDSDQSAALEKAAIELVEKAIKTLQEQSDLNEITLDPQNSYYRRLQHQRVEDLGFKSESVGEGKQRAVKIVKHK